ncbi:VanZ like family protein [Flaviramulus basaltis]|uniref:VanZ like family protein n=1 Tax=Flaviramulus basaltis TaxID=369401 RepID=A0A1K2IPB2_9FLAO|nr:hypothetical protein [Flaviramulus basaltis]SFZ94040.1 VanZ like family protein [Flaviramulus basaltis]
MRFNIYSIFMVFGLLIMFYFSWISSPRLSLNVLVPNWIANWADKHENDNLRTAIPMIFTGVFTGIGVLSKNASKKWWFLSWFLLALFVFIAEIGQLLLPLRSFDWKDVYWGGIGSGGGLLFVYFVNLMVNNIKK